MLEQPHLTNMNIITIPSLRAFGRGLLASLISTPVFVLLGIGVSLFAIATAVNHWNRLPIFGVIAWLACLISATAKENYEYITGNARARKTLLIASVIIPLLSTFAIIRPQTKMIVNGKVHHGYAGLIIPFVTETFPLKEVNLLQFTVYGETAEGIKVSALVSTTVHLSENTRLWKPTDVAEAAAQRAVQKYFATTLKALHAKDISNTLNIEFGIGSQAELAESGLVLKGALKVTDIHATF